ncbi:thioesterase domain-containing protein [Dokdonia sp.]|uniref:thioesterase II family protein n=1 Tax=Dokdonia sp. TaxID=2024995 RepID=UPI0032664EBC
MKILLFCLPYAGGSATIYHKWEPFLDSKIELRPLELAGRGKRIQHPMYEERSDAVDDMFNLIKDDVSEHPYIIMGHSLGALITYELVQKIRKHDLPTPLHVFFSGSSAPHLKDRDKKYHTLGESEFKREVINLGGTPPEFFDHLELVEIFMPLLKNDFRLAETNLPGSKLNPLDIDITVFLGDDDDLTIEQCEGWSLHSNKNCSFHYFKGGHFFLHEHIEKIVDIINSTAIKQFYFEPDSKL